MPQSIFITYSKDTQDDLVDIHTFNKYFTFQIDRTVRQNERLIQTSFYVPSSEGNEGFVFRLKAEINSAFSNEVQQGMRTTLIEKESGSILIDGTSIDYNEGIVQLDYAGLMQETEYILKYEFFERQIVSNQDLPDYQMSMSGTECRLPFITQELLIQDQTLIKKRVKQFQTDIKDKDYMGMDVKDFKCQLNRFNNTFDSMYGEDGVYCERKEYTYQMPNKPKDLIKIYEQDFFVRGTQSELITYWLDLTVGYNFLVGSGIKVLLSRNDEQISAYSSDYQESTLQCLNDKSCILSRMSNKNELRIEVILTSGSYKLAIFDHQDSEMRDFMSQEIGLTAIPFTFKLQSYPVLQNEERENCPYMYMLENFIQNKFIEGMSGQRFAFKDKIIMDIFNQETSINIKPETESILKLRIKEAFGVNPLITLVQGDKVIETGTRVGSTSVLFTKLSKGTSYKIKLSFLHSIIEFSDFFSCPHLNIELSMLAEKDALDMVEQQKCTSEQNWDAESKLSTIFNTLIDNSEDYTYQNHTEVFMCDADQSQNFDKTQNFAVNAYKFIVPKKMQLFVEVYYEEYLYDIELYLTAQEQNLVRQHIYKNQPKVDWSLYKGAKSIFVELESGEYEIQIIQKLPSLPDSKFKIYQPSCVNFQLHLRYGQQLNRQIVQLPPSLNFLGLLGPQGTDFGQMIFFCQDCIIENQKEKEIYFSINNPKHQTDNIVAIIESEESQVGIRLEEVLENSAAIAISASITKDSEGNEISVQKENKHEKGKMMGMKNRKSLGEDGAEEEINDSKLQSAKKYRLIITNKDYPKQQSATFTLRIELTEKSYKVSPKFQENLPKAIEEVARYKMKAEGLKESEFIIGTRYMLKYMNENALHPFIPLSDQIFQTKYKKEDYQIVLPFKVDEEEAEIFASIIDYTGVSNLGMSIYKDSKNALSWIFDSSSDDKYLTGTMPGKYHSYIEPISLTRGDYILVIAPEQKLMKDADSGNENILKFSIDFCYERENQTEGGDLMMDTMELCGLPSFPENFNSPQYIHSLGGNGMEMYQEFKIAELLQGSSLRFTLPQSSLVIFYMEMSKEIHGMAELTKTKGTYKMKTTTKDLNSLNDNFLRSKDLLHQNVIQFREYLNPGSYDIQLHANEMSINEYYSMPRCESFKIGFSTYSVTNSQYLLDQQCRSTTSLQTSLQFDKRVQGNLTYDLNTAIFDTSYVTTADHGEGPFLFYFHINYDTSYEGTVALVLSQYSTEDLSFTEIGLYEVQNSYSQLITVMEAGTYVLSIQTLSSLPKKYQTSGLGKSSNPTERKLARTSCLEISYSYYVASLIVEGDQFKEFDIIDFLAALFQGDLSLLGLDDEFSDNNDKDTYDFQIAQDIKGLDKIECKYDRVPEAFPLSDTGFDLTYTFPIGLKNFDMIDLVTESNQLLKIFIKTRNPRSNANAFLYDGADLMNLIVSTDQIRSHKEFTINLRPQKKAYKLKIVYDTLDQQSQCPVYDIRIAMKPLDNLVQEELKCAALPMPPEGFSFNVKDYDLEGEYSVSSTFIEKFQKLSDITYDIAITTPTNDGYSFDIETRFIYLTGNIDLELFVQDSKGDIISLAKSKWFNEEQLSLTDKKLDYYLQKDFVNRLQVISSNEDFSENQSLTKNYVLRLRFSKQMQKIINMLINFKMITKEQPICFPFDISIRISEPKNKIQYLSDGSTEMVEEKVELVRVEWPQRLNNELFDSRKKLTAFLEFDGPVSELFKVVRFNPMAYLIDEKQQSSYVGRIYPTTTRMSVVDKESMIITFKHNELNKGMCYLLSFEHTNGFVFNAVILKNQTRICTTNCLCNEKGTQRCSEAKGICICHFPYAGKDCGSCEPGHILDPITGDCVLSRKCEINGGTENCNNHGSCIEDPKTGQAKCVCDLGFSDDGYDYCSKCADSLFQYPDCMVRNWILEDSNVNCHNLPTTIPVVLFNNSLVYNPKDLVFQNDEGLLVWAGRYKLATNGEHKTLTQHFFIVPQNSVFRIFLDNLKSDALLSYKILDGSKKIVYQSYYDQKLYRKQDQAMLLLQQSDSNIPKKQPFVLEIEYSYEKTLTDPNWCPMFEIFMLIQPIRKIQEYLRCTGQEVINSKQIRQFAWQFGQETDFFNEKFTLTSDMVYGANNARGYITETDENFIVMSYNLKIEESGNALSIITSYNFASVMLSLTLLDMSTNNIVAKEKVSSLEDIQSNNQDISLDNDMTSYIEVPSLNKGTYELEIIIRKALFLPSEKFLTCLNFDLTLEYVVRKTKAQSESDSSNEEEQIEIISVFPTNFQKMSQSKKVKIDVQMSKKVDINELSSSLNDVHHICYMINEVDKLQTIYPYQVMVTEKNTMSLYFNFEKQKSIDSINCYQLICSTEFSLEGGRQLFKPSQIKTQYCFLPKEGSVVDTSFVQDVKCNPNAMSKVVDNKCMCNYPYTGPLCEQCMGESFVSKIFNGHTQCVIDQSKCSEDICNSNGVCLKVPMNAGVDEIICQCKENYNGKFCERCKNPAFAYPDCVSEAGMMDANMEKEILKRRKYNKDGYYKERDVKKKQQCPYYNYPSTLDAVEYMDFMGGPFHVADYYTINHDNDNIIQFTPRSQGLMKIFIQQPEDIEVIINDEAFDIEIGLYDKHIKKFVATSMNQHLNLQKQFTNKLEYAALTYQVPEESIGHKMEIIFRTLNFSVTANEMLSNCELVYMEIEFALQPSECLYSNKISQSSDITAVSDIISYKLQDTLSVYGETKQFFFYKDFYIGDRYETNQQPDMEDNAENNNFDLKISIQQKFMEKNQIDYVFEVLQNDVDFSEINSINGARSSQASKYAKPYCQDLCLVSGQKAYNEMHNIIQIEARTYFRVWLFQSEFDGSCANFQLFIEAAKASKKRKNQLDQTRFKCEELTLPQTLNTERYLGQQIDGRPQQDFHVIERFRVDNMRNFTTGHSMMFNLIEPTMIRFSAPVHKHIEFDLELREVFEKEGKKFSRKLIFSTAQDFEDTIFAQLDKGSYILKLIFISPEFYLNQPCQSIQIEMAMASIRVLQKDLLAVANVPGLGTTTYADAFSIEKAMSSQDRSMKVKRKGGVQTQKTGQNQEGFQSYVTLFNEKIKLPDMESLGILIQIQSNFLLNDVSFALTHLESGTIYHNLKRESQNKLILENVPSGAFELLVYTHNCLTNLNNGGYLSNIDIAYEIDFNLLHWSARLDDLSDKFLIMDIGDRPPKKFRAPLDLLHPKEMKCHANNMVLPEQITGGQGLVNGVDLDNFYMIMQIGYYEHKIVYRAGKGEDYLRIVVDRANTKVKLQKMSKQVKPEDTIQSFKINGGEVQVLIATAIEEGVDYLIIMEFGETDNAYELESSSIFCQSFKFQLKSSSSAKDCHKVVPDKVPVLTHFKENDYQQVELTMSSGNRVIFENFDIQKTTSDFADLEITIDYSYVFFPQSIQLYQRNQDTNQKGVNDFQRQQQNEIKPVEIEDDIKNLVKYRFKGLPTGTSFDLVVSLLQKPSTCSCFFTMTILTMLPSDKNSLLETDFMGIMESYTSVSQIQDLNRYVEQLPITLDNYKYLLPKEEFILVSEYIQLSADVDQNKISFSVTQNNTQFRLYVENADILLSLKETTSQTSVQNRKTNSLWGVLNIGDYEITFDFFTDLIKDQVLYHQDKLLITVMIAQPDFYETKYQYVQGKRIQNCKDNKNFPLSLNKQPQMSYGPEDNVYSYPLLRLSQETLFSKYVIDTYSFRVNQTSRFYINLGMHFLTSHLTIMLTEFKSYGMEYYGKQIFNQNQLDITLAPGDYAVTISQPTLFDNPSQDFAKNEVNKIECGLYSFYAHIQPLSGMEGGRSQSSAASNSKCELKETLPLKIYKSEGETKAGGEYFINQDGTFFKMFENILYKKNSVSMVNPEFDKIMIETKEDAILGFMIQYKQKGNRPMVKLHDEFTFDRTEVPISMKDGEAAGKVQELSLLFKVLKGRSYTLFVYYGGELNFNQDGQEICEYVNLYLSISHVSFVKQSMNCIDDNNEYKKQNIISFNGGLPKTITDKDFNEEGHYYYKHFVEMKYPQDYSDKAKQTTGEHMLYQGIMLNIQDSYDISTKVFSDFPDVFFNLGLVEKIEMRSGQEKYSQYIDISEQLPLFPLSGKTYEPTLARKIEAYKMDSGKQIQLAIIEEQSMALFDYLSEVPKTVPQQKPQPNDRTAVQNKPQEEFCVYFDLTIHAKKIPTPKAQAAISIPPTIVMITPESHQNQAFSLNQQQSQISVGIQFATPPYVVNTQSNGKLEKATIYMLAEIVMLKFFNPSTISSVLYLKKPVRIIQDQQSGVFFTFIFDISEEQQKTKQFNLNAILYISLAKLVNEKGQVFTMSDKIHMPRFSFQVETEDKEKIFEAEENESEILEKKAEIQQQVSKGGQKKANTVDEVKCLCVHGKCNPGSSQCNKCDYGWEGPLCDIQSNAKNINSGPKGQMGRKSRTDYESEDRSSQPSPVAQEKSKYIVDKPSEIKPKPNPYQDTYMPTPRDEQMPDFVKPIPQQPQSNYVMELVQTASSTIATFCTTVIESIFELQEKYTFLMISIYRVMLVLCLVVALIIGKQIQNWIIKKGQEKPYTPLSQNDDLDGVSPSKAVRKTNILFNFNQKQMELTDLTVGQGNKKKNKNQYFEERKEEYKYSSFESSKQEQSHDEFEASNKLAEELVLYSELSEQDQAQMQLQSPDKQVKFDEEQPQHLNEIDTANEIAAALGNDDEDEEEDFVDDSQNLF